MSLPAREVRDLPAPPRNYWRLVGPGVVAGGVALGSGEFVFWLVEAARHRGGPVKRLRGGNTMLTAVRKQPCSSSPGFMRRLPPCSRLGSHR